MSSTIGPRVGARRGALQGAARAAARVVAGRQGCATTTTTRFTPGCRQAGCQIVVTWANVCPARALRRRTHAATPRGQSGRQRCLPVRKAGVATAPGEAGPGSRPAAPKPRAGWTGPSRRPAVRYRRPARGHRRSRVLAREPTTPAPGAPAGRLGTPACPKRPPTSPRRPLAPGCPPPRARPDPRKRPGIPPRRTRPRESGSGHQ